MAAGLGFKTFNTGDVLTAADTNGYLMQGVLVFADAAARTAAVTSPQEGQTSYLKSDDTVYTYSGSAWVAVGSLPSQTGNSGKYLTTNGTVLSWGTIASAAATCVLTKSALQTIPATTNTAVTWNTELIDTDAFHSTSSQTSRITIPTGLAGKYEIQAAIQWTYANRTDNRLFIYKNGSQYSYNQFGDGNAFNNTVQISMVMDLAVADYIEIYVYHGSGGTNDITSATSGTYMNACTFQATRLGA